jgi:hypothetical protein
MILVLNSARFAKRIRSRIYSCPLCDFVKDKDYQMTALQENFYIRHLKRLHSLEP